MEVIATAIGVTAFGMLFALFLGWVLANTGGLTSAKHRAAHYALPAAQRERDWVPQSPVLFWLGWSLVFAVSLQPLANRIALRFFT